MSIDGIVPMEVEEFFSIPTGTHVYNYGADQCVALANLYDGGALKLPIPPGIQSAFQWWTLYDSKPQLSENFDQVTENPKRGDIFVGRYGPYQAENGHIGVVERDWDGSTFGTMETGYWSDGLSYVKRFNRNMSYILGFLRPKNGIYPTPVIEKEAEMKVVRSSGGQVALIGEYVANPLTGTTLSPGDVAWLASANEAVYGGSTVDDAQFNALMRDAQGRYNGLLNDIVSRMGNISLNVDAIAQAIAEKINGGVAPHVTTKSDILTSIEKNYPES